MANSTVPMGTIIVFAAVAGGVVATITGEAAFGIAVASIISGVLGYVEGWMTW